MKSLRIGCVKYLNARPLIRGWPGEVTFDHPSALCRKLAHGELDLALVSSFEFLRNPIYRIVDNVSISSNGRVYSVVVAHRGDISDMEEIELDPASETSGNLLRCLLAQLRLKRRLIGSIDVQSGQPTDSMLTLPTTRRARLFIGDQAIRFRQTWGNKFCFWDLGEQWQKLTNLPFVYALWLIRPEVGEAKSIAQRLRALRDENLANLDQLISDNVAGIDDPRVRKHFDSEFFSRYYREHLRFSFAETEKNGLRTFATLCVKEGLLPPRAVAFHLV